MEAGSQATRRKRACTSSGTPFSGESGLSGSPLRRVVRPRTEPSHRSHGPTLHGHAQRVPGLCKMSLDELKLLAKLDEMVVEMLEHMYFHGYGHGAGDYLMAAIKFVWWIQDFSDLPHTARALKGYRRSARGMSRGPLPWVAAAAMMGGNGCERRRVCGDAHDPVCGLLEAQRIVQSDSRPGHSSPQRVGRRQLGSPPGSPGRRPRKQASSTKASCWTVTFRLQLAKY